MKFSVVVPLYNKATYIVSTIRSVLAQTMSDFEVIVVDDGSSDGGAELVIAMDDSRVRVVRQANAGVAAARNKAISLARGEWVAFLDADDWYHPEYLASLVEVQKAYPGVDTVAAKYLPVFHASGTWPPAWPVVKKLFDIELISDLPSRWMTGRCLFTSSIAVKTQLLHTMQPCFPLGESRGEDLDLWFRLAEHSPIALACTPLVAYRVGMEESLSAIPPSCVTEPFLQRLQERALSGFLTAKQSKSLLRLVAQFEVSKAREALESGCRMDCLQRLLKARHAVDSRRWWATAIMAMAFPARVVTYWLTWRRQQASSFRGQNALSLHSVPGLVVNRIPKRAGVAPMPSHGLGFSPENFNYSKGKQAKMLASPGVRARGPAAARYRAGQSAADGLSHGGLRPVYKHQRLSAHASARQQKKNDWNHA